MEEKYYYYQHGLLFIVCEKIDTGMAITAKEDSRWEDEEKAKKHCCILNNSTNKKSVEKQHKYYHGDDCYIYETICLNCKEKVGGWTEEQANEAWDKHYCQTSKKK